jgi:phosphoglycerate kinase
MARELEYLGAALVEPKRPFVAVLGGAKVSDKIEVINSLYPKVDELLIGGAMACTFFLAQDHEVGKSLVERDKVDLAATLLERAGPKLVLPPGVVVATALSAAAERHSVSPQHIRRDWAVYDIDESAQRDFARRIAGARTVLWNGPMGVFETPPFDQGTLAVARALAEATKRGATTIVGGGDSAAALAKAGLEGQVTHVSTGGGASLEFLEGKTLPGVSALDDA